MAVSKVGYLWDQTDLARYRQSTLFFDQIRKDSAVLDSLTVRVKSVASNFQLIDGAHGCPDQGVGWSHPKFGAVRVHWVYATQPWTDATAVHVDWIG